MGHWPGDTCRYEHESRIFYAPKYQRQSTNSIKINCHRKLKCFTSITWPLLMGYWMTTIAVVISLIRKLYRQYFSLLSFYFLFFFLIAQRRIDTTIVYTFIPLLYEKLIVIFRCRFERKPAGGNGTQTYAKVNALR